MPNVPKKGAAGQIDQANPFTSGSEDHGAFAGPTTGVPSIQANVPAGAAGQTDPTGNSPSHGAAGGYEVSFETRKPPSQPDSYGGATSPAAGKLPIA